MKGSICFSSWQNCPVVCLVSLFPYLLKMQKGDFFFLLTWKNQKSKLKTFVLSKFSLICQRSWTCYSQCGERAVQRWHCLAVLNAVALFCCRSFLVIRKPLFQTEFCNQLPDDETENKKDVGHSRERWRKNSIYTKTWIKKCTEILWGIVALTVLVIKYLLIW